MESDMTIRVKGTGRITQRTACADFSEPVGRGRLDANHIITAGNLTIRRLKNCFIDGWLIAGLGSVFQ
jgi:hypothetical protein